MLVVLTAIGKEVESAQKAFDSERGENITIGKKLSALINLERVAERIDRGIYDV